MSFSTTAVLAPSVTRVTEAKPAGSADSALNSAAATEILNVSVAGKLIGVGIYVKAAPTGTPTSKVKINIDGAGFEDLFTIYSAGVVFTDAAKALAAVGDGSTIGDRIMLWLNLDFAASCVVALETTIIGSGGTLTGTALYSQEV